MIHGSQSPRKFEKGFYDGAIHDRVVEARIPCFDVPLYEDGLFVGVGGDEFLGEGDGAVGAE